MSSVSHVSTVDRGLKMKIKRTKVGPASGKSDPKHEVVKGEAAGGSSAQSAGVVGSGVHAVNGLPSSGSTTGANLDNKPVGAMSTPSKAGTSAPDLAKDRSPKVKTPFTKKDKTKDKGASGSAAKLASTDNGPLVPNGTTSSGSTISGSGAGAGGGASGSVGGVGGVCNGLDSLFPQVSMEPRVAVEAVSVRREVARPLLDPYEFNAKVEDGIGLPPKKLKTESKVESASSPLHITQHQDAATETCNVGVITEPECLGPCEPGTSVTLEGIVWQETENGVLVINVTWRGKTYVGTLLDATKHDWAPPRPNCESPVSDFETRLPKGRGKRGRANAGTPVSDRSLNEGRKLRKGRRGSGANFQAPPSPARSDTSSVGGKRKARPTEDSEFGRGDKGTPNSKRSRSCSRGGASGTESPTPSIIECPEPNCNKKYKHINGLRYHQTHAHHHPVPVPDDDKEEEEDMDTDSTKDSKKDSSSEGKDSKKEPLSERAERMKAKELRQREKEREKSLEKDCSSIEDNIPLKAFVASRVNAQNMDKSKDTYVALSKDGARVELTAVSTSVSAASLASSSPLSSSVSVTSKKKDGGPTMSVAMSVSKTSASGQVYQISGVGCLGGMPVMASTNTVQAPVVTPAIAVTASSTTPTNPIPITVAPLGTPDQVNSKDSIKSADKTKISKITARPIVPAPSSQMMSMSSSVPASQASLVSSPGHSQVNSSLKMIQPKPTIMGDYPNVNPALADLKEKRSKSKKKKEKDGPQSGANQSGGSSPLGKPSGKDDQGKNGDRPAVIKSVASSPVSRPSLDLTPRKDGIPSIEVSKPLDSPRTPVSSAGPLSSPVNSQSAVKSQDQVRTVQPPGLLKVNSPLHVSASERKTPINDDVQSPAYSDISDANDSSSPQQQESPKKDGEVAQKKDDSNSGPVPPGEGSAPSPYGMYYNFGRPSFLSPTVSAPHSSPNSTKPPSQKKEEGSRPDDSRGMGPQDEARKNVGDRPEDKDASKGPPSSKADGPPTSSQQQQQQQQQPSQQQIQEYQQKWLQHVYSQIRMLPQQAQYQYLAAYGMLDPYQHQMHFVNHQDPQYRQMMERASQEQKKMQEQGGAAKKPEMDPGKNKPCSRPPSTEQGTPTNEAGSSGSQKPLQSLYGASGSGADRLYDGKSIGDSADERDLREQALREKQNENHQILKENIELKSQMDRGRQEMLKQDELRRMQMYQQQRFLEQQQKRKVEMHGKPPELTSTGKPSGLLPGGIKTEDIKKESVDNIRIKDMSARTPDGKSVDDKKMGGEKGRGGLSDTSKSKDPPSSGSHILTSVASSTAPHNPPSAPPGQYSPYAAYPGMYPHFGPHLQVDPSHPMYRSMNPHMIGFASAPPGAYLHPSQLGYRMGPVDVEKEGSKSDGKPSGPPPSADSPKGSSEGMGSQYYNPVHKIHELQEKARPRPGSASPSPTGKSGEGSTTPTSTSALADKQREYSKSPPTQRHLHTHHHTHVLSHGFPVTYSHDPYSAAAMFGASPHGPPAPSPASIQPPFSK